MGEGDGTKISLTAAILFFLLIIAIIGFAMICTGISKKCKEEKVALQSEVVGIEQEVEVLAENKTEEVLTEDKTEKEDYSTINLSDTEKKDINTKLKNYIEIPLRLITGIEFEKDKDFIYNSNLLNEEKNKYYIVIETMLKEINSEFSFVNSEGQEETGAIAISIDRVNDYYKKIYGKEMNKDELLNSDITYGVEIKDEILYGSYPTGFGLNPFELKAKTLEKNDITGIYTLKVDVLMKIIGQESYNRQESYNIFDEDVTVKYGDTSVLTWPEEYNYATLEIQYKKDVNGNNQLVSLMFLK